MKLQSMKADFSKETDDDEALLLLELEDVTLVLVFVAVEDCLL